MTTSYDGDKPLRIVQSVREIGEGGGVSGVAYQLERQFQRMGYECERWTIERLGLQPNRHRNRLRRKMKMLVDVIAYSVLGSWRLYREYRRRDDVVVISHNDSLYGDVYVMHGLHKAYLSRSPRKYRILLRNPLHWFFLLREEIRYRLKCHPVIVTFSEYNKQDILRHYPVRESDIRLIPNGVDVDKFKPMPEIRRQVRGQLGFQEDDFVLIFVGHEFERKGLIFVLDALRLLVERGKPAKLIIAGRDDPGQPPIRQRLDRLAAHVRLVGFRRDIERYYNAADAFVLPSTYEAWPLVGLEAMACGLPVLMTPTGSVNVFLADGENGFFVRQDGADIAEKVSRLMDKGPSYGTMSAAARQTALQYSWESIARQYLDVLHEIHRAKKTKKEAKSFVARC